MRFGLFGRSGGRSAAERAAADRLRADVARVLALSGDTTVTVSEIDCADPSCPGLETVILVARPGQRLKAYKLAGPLADVTEQDLHHALLERGNE